MSTPPVSASPVNTAESKERVRRATRLIAELRARQDSDTRLADEVESLLTEYGEIEDASENEKSLATILTRMLVMTERLERYLAEGVEAEKTQAEAAVTAAKASELRAQTLAKVATPRNFMVAILVLGGLIAGAIGLPVIDIVRIFKGDLVPSAQEPISTQPPSRSPEAPARP